MTNFSKQLIDPDYCIAYQSRGDAKDELKDSKGSREDWNKASELKGENDSDEFE